MAAKRARKRREEFYDEQTRIGIMPTRRQSARVARTVRMQDPNVIAGIPVPLPPSYRRKEDWIDRAFPGGVTMGQTIALGAGVTLTSYLVGRYLLAPRIP